MEIEPDLPKPSVRPPDLIPPPPAPPLPAPAPSPAPAPAAEPAESERQPDPGDGEGVPPAGGDASFESRVVAAILDMFVFGFVFWAIASFAPKLALLGALGYVLTRDALPFLEGQSIGKKIMKLRAVKADGRPLTGDWQGSIVRNLLLAIPFGVLVELAVIYTRRYHDGALRRLGDDWAKTRVIVAPGPPAI
jgi:uncharacterized RDD family membrane protein YckC